MGVSGTEEDLRRIKSLRSPPISPAVAPSPAPSLLTQVARLTPHLYLAPATALTPDRLNDSRISLVVNVTKELPLLPLDGARSLRIGVSDDTLANIFSYFRSITDAIQGEVDKGGVVLVHCVAGVSRSATICLAYLIRHNHMSLQQAWQHVKKVRPWVKPNKGFLQQLSDWEKMMRPGEMPSQLPLTDGTR